jgi:hypothetical protein
MKIAHFICIVYLLLPGASAFALGQKQYVTEAGGPGDFPIYSKQSAAEIFVETNDFPGVVRAANDLQTDIHRTTDGCADVFNQTNGLRGNVIIVGTVGKSEIIDRLIRKRKIDVAGITGKWESFLIQTVSKPTPGVDRALVICGSDQRGTIYGIYDLSEQMGVSPWYFWEDVRPKHHAELFVKAGKYIEGPPAVKYRGIFLNDEAPDLSGWVKEKYGDYNHGFYTNVFELLLRLKANYLWPAMWNNCFNEDDPLNPKLASEYGIVMGTSHVEPMMRADKEWNRAGYTPGQWNFEKAPKELADFWREGIERNRAYENIITIAMRGKIDTPMSESANIGLLERIVDCQRQIIGDVYHTNAATVPQLWALYKEVQEYYEKGMRVPDDVTLLWCDDNWGNLRKLPAANERQRSGGAGIYYHFDYVGGPRNYKWVDGSPIARIWEQMNLAYEYGADRVWIVNVGHLQHVAFPTEFFLSMARDPKRWSREHFAEFTRAWAEREFGAQYADDIAELVDGYTRLNGLRKPELLAPETFSVINYQEADGVLVQWRALVGKSYQVEDQLPAGERDAFYELVAYPLRACANLNELYVAVAKNRLYAAQGRASANEYAKRASELFQADAAMSAYYNTHLAGGKWSHMMDQTHIGYTGWQQPPSNTMPQVITREIPEAEQMGIAMEGATNHSPGSSASLELPIFDRYGQARHYFDVFNRGMVPFIFSAAASAPWISLSESKGDVGADQRVWVNIDWKRAPSGTANGSIKLTDEGTNSIKISVLAFNPVDLDRKTFTGFVEGDGCVSMDAEHFNGEIGASGANWQKIDGLGRTASAMSPFPVTAQSVMPLGNSPCLEYRMYLFHAGEIRVESYLSPSLNFIAGRGLRMAVSFDGQPPQILTVVPEDYSVGAGDGNIDWEQAVKDNIRKVDATLHLDRPGEHVLKVWMVDPGIVLQKIVVDTGGVKPSYLGPPESFYKK